VPTGPDLKTYVSYIIGSKLYIIRKPFKSLFEWAVSEPDHVTMSGVVNRKLLLRSTVHCKSRL